MNRTTELSRKGWMKRIIVAMVAIFAAVALFGTVAQAGNGKVSMSVKAKDISSSIDEVVAFGADNIFTVNSATKVKQLQVKANRRSDSQTVLKSTDPKWVADHSPSSTVYNYKSNSTLSKDEIQSLLNLLVVEFDTKGGYYRSGDITLTISYGEDKINNELKNDKAKITFYEFARGTLKTDSVDVGYQANDGNGKYLNFVDKSLPEDEITKSAAVPIYESQGATVDFTLNIDNSFGGAKSKVEIGYQVKKANENWQDVSFVKMKTLEKWYGSWNYVQRQHDISIGGLSPATDYDVRAVVVTDGYLSTAKNTNSVRVRYDRPTINSFNVGTTDIPVWGETDKTLEVAGVFNNKNYDNKYVRVSPSNSSPYYHLGAQLQIEAFFTENFTAEKKNVMTPTGYVAAHEDTSKWSSVGRTFMKVQDGYAYSDADFKRNIAQSFQHKLPKADSQNCAYKIVVTDTVTGFSTYYVSESFTVDSERPSKPNLYSLNSDGEIDDLGYGEDQKNTVGGENANVQLYVDGSTDKGSGLKEYNYSIYYLSTEEADKLNLKTTEDILKHMSGFNENSFGGAIYTDWTAIKPDEDNMATFSVAKDGYYRAMARAVDYAGRVSDIDTRYFRVDLSVPATPSIRLVRNDTENGGTDENPIFKPYDSRTYSTSEVWMLMDVPPMIGKTIEDYQISFDSGLDWIDHFDAPAYGGGGTTQVYYTETVDLGNGTVYLPFDDRYLEAFEYQVCIKLSSNVETEKYPAISGYQSVIARVRDTLGNTSLASNARLMRTTDVIETGGTLRHEGIEVALSMGKTTIGEKSSLTARLKNAAARKINNAYYGETSPEITQLLGHTCVWKVDGNMGGKDDTACIGPCSDPACTYAKYGETTEYYTPAMVNVQGISSQDAGSGPNNWGEYDHNTANAVYGMKDNTIPVSRTLTKADEGMVTAGTSGNQYSNSTRADPVYKEVANGQRTQCLYRSRHFIDYSTESGAVANETEKPFQRILAMGVSAAGWSDWKFLPNDQDTEKSMIFTIDEALASFHTYDGGGFIFGSTIRKNNAGTWVISGYMFMNSVSSNAPHSSVSDKVNNSNYFASTICKLTDVNVNTLLNSSHDKLAERTNLGITQVAKVAYPVVSPFSSTTGDTRHKIKNFKLITEDGKTTVYWTAGPGFNEEEHFNLFTNSSAGSGVNTGKDSNGNSVQGGKLFQNINTPVCTVDGTSAADKGDGDAWGFGPIVAYLSHGCTDETKIEFSDITMMMDVVRRLSEVVTEPQWGGGKAKYIVNLSDDSTDDFKDPQLSAQIQWRLFNDNAKFVGWGDVKNKKITEDFLKRIEGEGYFQSSTYEAGGKMPDAEQIDGVAEYITRSYYMEFGFTEDQIKDGLPMRDHVVSNSAKRGIVYSMDDIANIDLSVTPSQYNDATANADYPSGRWFIVHDVAGYDNATQSARHYTYSDALNLKITDPGRYTIYFAPDADRVANNTLNPNDAIFDFVVSQKPVALFTGSIDKDTNIVTVKDAAYDPDSPKSLAPMARDQKYTYKNSAGVPVERSYNDMPGDTNIQVNGVKETWWKFEILSEIGTGDNKTLEVKYASGWEKDTYDVSGNLQSVINGKTLDDLTGGEVKTLSGKDVMTVYQQVVDTASRINARYDDSTGEFQGYYFTEAGNLRSRVIQQNITTGADVTFPPLSTFSLSTVNIYDTAVVYGDPDLDINSEVYVYRNSSHPQGRAINVDWEVDVGGPEGYEELTLDPATGNYSLVKSATGRKFVLECVEKPETMVDDKGRTGTLGGVWKIKKQYIQEGVGGVKGKNVVLRIKEAAFGKTAEDMNSSNPGSIAEHDIIDASARAIYYREDTTPPSAQSVVVKTMILKDKDNDIWEDTDYEASNYLDVTNADKKVRITASGSSDGQGELAGYGFYLYSKNKEGKVQDYYKLVNGAKVKVDNAKDATTPIAAKEKDDKAIIEIDHRVMGEGVSNDRISVAVWAFDNQTGKNTNTGANETAPTRIEDIKFSKSVPVAPEITVTDGSNKNVASIGNEYGFDDSAELFPGIKDEQTTDEERNNFSMTAVTLKFNPRKSNYEMDEFGDLNKVEEGGTTYYEDTAHQADRTNKATVVYTIEKKDRQGAYQIYTYNGVKYENASIDPALSVTINETGNYRVTAKVKNGANAESLTRQVEFSIDLDKPTDPKFDIRDADGDPYDGDWTKSARINLSGSTDESNSADSYYTYSLDNGATWTKLANNLNEARSFEVNQTGTHQVRMKAVDPAGNESKEVTATIKVDNTVPRVDSIEASSMMKTVNIYDEFIIKTLINGEGKIYPIGGPSSDDSTDFSFEVGINYELDENGDPAKDENGEDIILGYQLGRKMFNINVPNGHKITAATYGNINVLPNITDMDGYFLLNTPVFPIDVERNPNFEANLIITVKDSNQPDPEPEEDPGIRVMSDNSPFTRSVASGETRSVGYAGTLATAASGEVDDDGYFTIRAGFGGGAALEQPSGTNTAKVMPGDNYSVKYRAFAGNHLASLSINGVPQSVVPNEEGSPLTKDGNIYTYTFENVADNYEIYAGFEASPIYKLFLNEHGKPGDLKLKNLNDSSVASSPTQNDDGSYSVYKGATLELEANPGSGTTGYALTSLKVNDNVLVDGEAQLQQGKYPFTVIAGAGDADDTSEEDRVINVDATFDISKDYTRAGVEIVMGSGATVWPSYDTIMVEKEVEPEEGEEEASGEPETILVERKVVTVPYGSTQTFRITVAPGYTLHGVEFQQRMTAEDEWEDPTSLPLTESADGRTFSVTPPALYGNDQGDTLRLIVDVKENRYEVTRLSNEGGTITEKVYDANGEEIASEDIDWASMPENSSVDFEFTPAEGYKISTVKVNGFNRGTASKLSIKNIISDQEVEVVFEKKRLSKTDISHSLTIEASGAKDDHAGIATAPYYYTLNAKDANPTWTRAAESNTYEFKETLEPNKLYYVQVAVEDRVGNIGYSEIVEVYTKANQGCSFNVEAVDKENDSSRKTVRLYVDKNGNPDDTEYVIRWSPFPAMNRDVKYATRFDEELQEEVYDWQRLTNVSPTQGYIEMENLDPGTPYYLTVDSRNSSDPKEVTSGSYLSEHIQGITLSHAAPKEATLFFREQTVPGGPVYLGWDTPPSDVSNVIINRDGYFLASVPRTITEWYDETTLGNSVYVYSYAYENEAGVGSSRTAVSETYRDAYLKVHGDEAAPTDEDEAALQDLDDMIYDKNNDSETFSEVLTFPMYPKRAVISYASIEGTSNLHQGDLTIRVEPEESMSDRLQKYELELVAYEKVGDNYVEVDIENVPEIPFDNYGRYNNQITTYSRNPGGSGSAAIKNAGGSSATWEGLYTELAYGVRIKQVITTGPKIRASGSIKDGYDGAEYGMEGTLGKMMYVDENGYHIDFHKDRPGSVEKQNLIEKLYTNYGLDSSWTWDAGTSGAYANPLDPATGWNRDLPLYSEIKNIEPEVIKFNTMPKVELPSSIEDYFGPDSYDEENGYVLIDQGGDNTKFSVNLAIWDEDDDTPFLDITAAIEGLSTGTVRMTDVPQSKPTDIEDYYSLVFDGKSLRSGIYDKISVRVSDGELTARAELPDPNNAEAVENFKIVVNQVKPNIQVVGGNEVRKIEKNTDFNALGFTALTSLNTDASMKPEQIRELRLTILKDDYQRLFGATTVSGIEANLKGGNSTAIASVRELLGSEADTYIKNGVWTDANGVGLLKVIDAVNPSVKKYLQVSKSAYDNVSQADRDKYFIEDKILGENNVVVDTFYWAEYEYALSYNNNSGLSSWLKRIDGKDIIVGSIGEKHPIKLSSHFGKNASSITNYFTIATSPSIELLSNSYWNWIDVEAEEFEYYYEGNAGAGFSIADVAGDGIFKGVYDDLLPAEYATNNGDGTYTYTESAEETKAFRRVYEVEGDDSSAVKGYQVYKYYDEHMIIGQRHINATINVITGVYDKFEKVGIRLYSNPDDTPSTPGATFISAEVLQNDFDPGVKSGVHTLPISGLQKGTTYYLYSYFTYIDQITKEEKTVFNPEQIRVTTENDLMIAYYSLDVSEMTIKEQSAKQTVSKQLVYTMPVSRSGDDGVGAPMAKIKAEIDYFMANEDGEAILDENNEMIPVPFDVGSTSANNKERTLALTTPEVVFTENTEAGFINLRLNLYDNDFKQGHMLARLRINIVKEDSKGCNYLVPGADEAWVFVIDDETPMKQYKVGVINNPVDGKTPMKDNGRNYEYAFPGLDAGYSFSEAFEISYYNKGAGKSSNGTVDEYKGSGDLNNIRVGVYENKVAPGETPVPSTKFSLAGDISTPYLASREQGGQALHDYGSFLVAPNRSLSDGVHKAWVCIMADKMEESDYVWIELTQIVGQSTLSGMVYFTDKMPSTALERSSVAKVSLYRDSANFINGEFIGEPDYVTYTDPNRSGSFEIKNILNNGVEGAPSIGYFIVVEKDGYLTYNTIEYYYRMQGSSDANDRALADRAFFKLEKDSRRYELNIKLMAGDIDGDDECTLEKDYPIFTNNFNKTYNLLADDKTLKQTNEYELKLCDYNFDGIVNVIDRMVIRDYLSLSSRNYRYSALNEDGDPVNGGKPVDRGKIQDLGEGEDE